VVYGEQEFLVVHGEASPQFYGNVVQHKCRAWGGGVQTAGQDTETTDDDTWEDGGDLATFASKDEWDQVQLAIDATLEASTAEWPVFAGFVGVGWSGDISRDWVGSWDWLDGAEESSFSLESIPFCDDDKPTPGDILPKMTPEDPLHGPTFEQQLPKWRLSLVKPYGSDWCWGLPKAAVPPADADGDTGVPVAGVPAYDLTSAHYICERPKPDEEQWSGTSIGPITQGPD
jgi:hypothetical protein